MIARGQSTHSASRRGARCRAPGLWLTVLACVVSSIVSSQGQPSLERNHPRFRIIETVFEDLVRAIGDGHTKPRLRVIPARVETEMNVAWFEHNSGVLALEERAYDLCAAMGADSLNALGFSMGFDF